MERPFGWALSIFLLLLGAPTVLEAVFVPETPHEIVQMPGMIPALITCLVGLYLLRFAPSPPESAAGRQDVGTSRWSHWTILIAYIMGLYATIPYGFEFVSFIVNRIGIQAFRKGINGTGLVAGLLFVRYVVSRPGLRGWLIYLRLAAILAVYVYFFAILEVPVKRIHFLEFSFLSVLVFRALRAFTGAPAIYLWTTLAAMAVGVGDEGIALFFPRRFAAVTDVIWDTTGGVLGALVLKFILLKGSR